MEQANEPKVSISEAARRAGVQKSDVRKLIVAGDLPTWDLSGGKKQRRLVVRVNDLLGVLVASGRLSADEAGAIRAGLYAPDGRKPLVARSADGTARFTYFFQVAAAFVRAFVEARSAVASNETGVAA